MRRGMAAGYLLPKILAEKMVPQMAGFDHGPVEKHLFYSPITTLPATFSAEDRARLTEAYKKMIADKIVYERSYRVEDSIPKMKWKLLGEFRNIAGFNCRKAATIIMDSIYIIAFYTDEIPVSAGPESFQGLPGMILGIVIPRLNITYFATKVENLVLPETEFITPTAPKNKKTNILELKKEILKDTKEWGEDGPKIYWKVML
jgi:GLPGLI family protein